MDVLIVEDEEGIREGLAAFLRLRGHCVRTASDVAAALAALGEQRYDAVVSDWRLGDGVDAGPVLDAAGSTPCLVASGYGADVADHPAVAVVLEKPVVPHRLLDELERAVPAPRVGVAADPGGAWSGLPLDPPLDPPHDLPIDVREWLDAVRWLVGPVAVADEGDLLTVTATLPGEPPFDALRALGGDLRVRPRDGAGTELTVSIDRRGRPDGFDALVGPSDRWPEGPVAVDLGGTAPPPAELERLLHRIAAASRPDRPVVLVNVPAAVRHGAVALGWGELLPMRPVMGPRIPAELEALWRPMR